MATGGEERTSPVKNVEPEYVLLEDLSPTLPKNEEGNVLINLALMTLYKRHTIRWMIKFYNVSWIKEDSYWKLKFNCKQCSYNRLDKNKLIWEKDIQLFTPVLAGGARTSAYNLLIKHVPICSGYPSPSICSRKRRSTEEPEGAGVPAPTLLRIEPTTDDTVPNTSCSEVCLEEADVAAVLSDVRQSLHPVEEDIRWDFDCSLLD